MASVGSEDGDVGFQIAPMVDVVFVLMLFFMASAGSQIKELHLSINLPGGSAAKGGIAREAPPVTPIVVEINSEGSVIINGDVFGTPSDKTLGQLRNKLKAMMEYGGEDPVIIRPSLDVKHERVMEVLAAAAHSNVKKLSFG